MQANHYNKVENLYQMLAEEMISQDQAELGIQAAETFSIEQGNPKAARWLNKLIDNIGVSAAEYIEKTSLAGETGAGAQDYPKEAHSVIKVGGAMVKVFVRRISYHPAGYGIYMTTEKSIMRLMADLKKVYG